MNLEWEAARDWEPKHHIEPAGESGNLLPETIILNIRSLSFKRIVKRNSVEVRDIWRETMGGISICGGF
jgi:hypothetical protein